jgi:hypothetical protein
MPYELSATSTTPALIIYLIDVSASMTLPLGKTFRLKAVVEALSSAIEEMVGLSTKGKVIAPRYRIAMFAYSDEAFDVLNGIQTIDRVAQLGSPVMQTLRGTNPAAAFLEAERLLRTELPRIQDHPAPLVCHLTDGEYDPGYDDPEPIARRIMSLNVKDGGVLIENIFISDKVLAQPIRELEEWNGVLPDTPLKAEYASKLRNMSSPFPESYRRNIFELGGYRLAPDALMFLPGDTPALVKMGFQISAMTQIAR